MKKILFLLILLLPFSVFAQELWNPNSTPSPFTAIGLDDDVQLLFGTGDDFACEYDTAVTPDSMVCGVGADSKIWYIVDKADISTDWARSANTNPTLCIQSADQATVTDRICLNHNQTDAAITVDGGDLLMNIAGANLAPSANDGAALGISGTAWSDLFLASGGVIDFNADMTITHAADSLTVAGGTLNAAATAVTSLSMSDLITWSAGAAITAGSYQIGRDADATNQLHFNVPTGASFEFSINDTQEYTFDAAALEMNNNVINNIGGSGTDFFTGGRLTVGQSATTAGNTTLTVQQANHTAITLNRPAIDSGSFTNTVQSGGTIGVGSAVRLQPPTYVGVAGGGTETVTDMTTLYISGPAVVGADLTNTDALSIFVDAGVSRFDGGVKFSTTGVLVTDDADGAITFLGLGNGSDENFTINLDDNSDTIAASSSTGVTTFSYGTIDLKTDGIDLSEGNLTNGGSVSLDSVNADATTVDYNDVNIIELTQADLTVGSCTLGQIRFDTGGAADELCYCSTSNVWSCVTMVAGGPVD